MVSTETFERIWRALGTSASLALSGAPLERNIHQILTHVHNSCLDDEELELLGVPWAEYSSTAVELGFDVLRSETHRSLPRGRHDVKGMR